MPEPIELQAQKGLHALRRLEHRSRLQLLRHRAARDLQHRADLRALGGPQALDALQVLRLCTQQPLPATEGVEQRLRQLQHALAGEARAQQQRQQLGIGQGRRALCEQLLARAQRGGQVLDGHDLGVRAG